VPLRLRGIHFNDAELTIPDHLVTMVLQAANGHHFFFFLLRNAKLTDNVLRKNHYEVFYAFRRKMFFVSRKKFHEIDNARLKVCEMMHL